MKLEKERNRGKEGERERHTFGDRLKAGWGSHCCFSVNTQEARNTRHEDHSLISGSSRDVKW